MEQNEQMPLGDRQKFYEKTTERVIDPSQYIIVRIDGHKFSKFTKGFNKPFDEVLSTAMIETTKELVKRFNAVTGYTQSDEITLLIPPEFNTIKTPSSGVFRYTGDNYIAQDKTSGKEFTVCFSVDDDSFDDMVFDGDQPNMDSFIFFDEETKKEHIIDEKELYSGKYNFFKEVKQNNQVFGGRVRKIESLGAAYATVRFNAHLRSLFMQAGIEKEEKLDVAYFDAKAFGVPDKYEAFNSVLWRCRDCEKNSRSMFAQAYCSHKSLLNKTGEEQVGYCLETTGNDWNKIEDKYKYGTFIKNESYVKETENGTAPRTRLVEVAQKLTFSDENVEFLLSKVI